jgi:iron complex outermembrane receptor protein
MCTDRQPAMRTGTAGNPLPSKCRVDFFIDFDLTGEYKVTRYLDVFGAVENLFDNKPPLDPANYAANNYNPTWSQAGIIGRFFKAGFRIHFK